MHRPHSSSIFPCFFNCLQQASSKGTVTLPSTCRSFGALPAFHCLNWIWPFTLVVSSICRNQVCSSAPALLSAFWCCLLARMHAVAVVGHVDGWGTLPRSCACCASYRATILLRTAECALQTLQRVVPILHTCPLMRVGHYMPYVQTLHCTVPSRKAESVQQCCPRASTRQASLITCFRAAEGGEGVCKTEVTATVPASSSHSTPLPRSTSTSMGPSKPVRRAPFFKPGHLDTACPCSIWILQALPSKHMEQLKPNPKPCPWPP